MRSRLSAPPVLGLNGFLRSQSVLGVVRYWVARRNTRLNLSRLDAHLLRDIGLNERDVTAECTKPFWRD
ncbi:MAG: hypothetical protein DI533_03220 [Cereibacter sphaeroides]|uniref:YjiS-like domain-containing protein n=1 Tax=Cereibacter sphaeroides TaxID=1063 RepID=A0A2W5U8F1_CERSP|nr:MAG: hypothetical protein DI533_03220 [Cereibacter sphaeroides]